MIKYLLENNDTSKSLIGMIQALIMLLDLVSKNKLRRSTESNLLGLKKIGLFYE